MIKERLGLDAVTIPGKTGEFRVIADGETIAQRGGNFITRKFGAGYPDLDGIVRQIEQRRRAIPN